ncbi:hypothetical protein CALVIDRAFT_20685 [Calocera viscosa TUFC12733]|uniref:Uncharacterized protein n=1 Tax=Calocera viscosa (strain TUFC12733) TaxID=1330018 RepID=A0A167SFX6_CALVF|nr:hypothetical protein CALVIDRAFT_20685 [Calocera viscosa TUFC12733]
MFLLSCSGSPPGALSFLGSSLGLSPQRACALPLSFTLAPSLAFSPSFPLAAWRAMHLSLLSLRLLLSLLPTLLVTASPTPGLTTLPQNLTAPLHISGNCIWSGASHLCLPLCLASHPALVYVTNATSTTSASSSGDLSLSDEPDQSSSSPCPLGSTALCCTPSAPAACHLEVHNSTCLNVVYPYPSSSAAAEPDTAEPDPASFLSALNSTLPPCTLGGDTLLMREVQVRGLYGFNNGHTGQMWMTCDSWGVSNLCCAGSVSPALLRTTEGKKEDTPPEADHRTAVRIGARGHRRNSTAHWLCQRVGEGRRRGSGAYVFVRHLCGCGVVLDGVWGACRALSGWVITAREH